MTLTLGHNFKAKVTAVFHYEMCLCGQCFPYALFVHIWHVFFVVWPCVMTLNQYLPEGLGHWLWPKTFNIAL